MSFHIEKDRKPPVARPSKRRSLTELVALADEMKVGDAVLLTLSQSQTFRIILAAKGFMCVTNGYDAPCERFRYPRPIWCFKMGG